MLDNKENNTANKHISLCNFRYFSAFLLIENPTQNRSLKDVLKTSLYPLNILRISFRESMLYVYCQDISWIKYLYCTGCSKLLDSNVPVTLDDSPNIGTPTTILVALQTTRAET